MIRNILLFGLSVFSPMIFWSCKTEPVNSDESSYAADSAYEDQEEPQGSYFSDYHILAVNGFLLGGCQDDQWIDCDELYPLISDEEEYKVYIDGQYQSTEKGNKEPEIEYEIYCGPGVNLLNSDYDYKGESDIIAYSGERDLMIEGGTKISPENQTYQEINKAYIAKMGLEESDIKRSESGQSVLKNEFELRNIIKVDIDGDQQDEVFLQSFRYADPIHESVGIQYMRKIVAGEVMEFTVPIVSPANEADQIRIIGFCDLNGDGVKEVLMSSSGTGYSSYMVYEFKNNEFRRIFENGAEH